MSEDSVPMQERSNPMSEHSVPMQERSNPMSKHFVPTSENNNPMWENSFPTWLFKRNRLKNSGLWRKWPKGGISGWNPPGRAVSPLTAGA